VLKVGRPGFDFLAK